MCGSSHGRVPSSWHSACGALDNEDDARHPHCQAPNAVPQNKGTSPMTPSLTQFTITEVSAEYWRVTFSNPPINLCDPDTLLELQHLVGLIESADTLRVVVLDSADPDFFINHYDVSRVA